MIVSDSASAGLVVRSPYLLTFRDPDFLCELSRSPLAITCPRLLILLSLFAVATVDIAIWSTVEQGLAITAGSLATTRPLLRLWSQKMGLTTSTPNKLGYSDGPNGAGHSGTGALGAGLGGGSNKHGNKSQVESYNLSSNRNTRKGGGSWDGLDSDPEDGMIHHNHGTSGNTGTGRGNNNSSHNSGGGFGGNMSSSPPGAGVGAKVTGGGKKAPGATTRTLNGNDSQEELQSSGLSSENVVVTRSFLITDERV